MLRTLPFIAVREQQHQTADLAPFLLGGRKELVDHDLGAVGEIAKLRLPQRERPRIGDAEAVFKAQDGEFAERTVYHIEARLIVGHVLQRDISSGRPDSRKKRGGAG